MTVVNIEGKFFDTNTYFCKEPRLTDELGNEYAWRYAPGQGRFSNKDSFGVYRWSGIVQIDASNVYLNGKKVTLDELLARRSDPLGQPYLSLR